MKRLTGWIALCALVGAFSAPMALAQENAEPLMWLSWAEVKPGGQGTYAQVMQQSYGVVFDRMMKSGDVIGWGLAAKANHDAGPSHVMWVIVGDWSAMDRVFNAIDDDFEARRPGEVERLFGAFREVADYSAHFDTVVRHTVFNWAPGGDVAPKYILTDTWTAKPGADVMGLYDEYVLPLNEDLRARGVIHSFGVYEPALHDGSGITHVGWAFIKDLSKIDAVDEAFERLNADAVFSQKVADAFDFSTHRDYIWEVLHLGGMPEK